MVALLAFGCTGAPAATDAKPAPGETPQTQAGRTMTMVIRYEATDLAPKILGSSSPELTKRLFNASLSLLDGDESPRPYLAESLPQLDTDSWQVFPDGRMETTWKLRPNLTWHDGQPLTADDFVFAYQVYTAPAMSVFTPVPQDRMEDVVAVDPTTLLIKWRAPYPDAGALIMDDFDALPKHILQDSFTALQQDPSAFLNQSFWTTDYVGAGPYRLDHWDPGAELVGTAFAGHALGKPKIDRVSLKIISDDNTALSNILSGTVDYTAQLALRFENTKVLKQDWEPSGKGKVFYQGDSPQMLAIQMRPQYLQQPALLDLRVRQAIAHTMDREGINDGLFDGIGYPSELLVPTLSPHFADVDGAVTKHPYDPKRSEQLMTEAGYTKDRDGMYVSASGERVTADVKVTASPQFERGNAILTNTWKQNGFDMTPSVVPPADARDRAARQTFPGMASRGGTTVDRMWLSTEIGSAQNRWQGDNRGGYSNPEYDRIYDSYAATLDGGQRAQQFVQLMKIINDQIPVYMMYFDIHVVTASSRVRGVTDKTIGTEVDRGTLPYWNIQEWDLN